MRSRGQVQSPAAQFPEGSPEGCTPPSGCHQDMHQQKKEGGGTEAGEKEGGKEGTGSSLFLFPEKARFGVS